MKKIFSFAVCTDGFWGQAFIIGALVYDENGAEIARFLGRLPDTKVTHRETRIHVLSEIADIPVTHGDYDSLLADFAAFCKANMDVVVVHAVPPWILRDFKGLICEWKHDSTLFYDVSRKLEAAGADFTSPHKFAHQHGLSGGKFVGGRYNPLYECSLLTAIYCYLTGKAGK